MALGSPILPPVCPGSQWYNKMLPRAWKGVLLRRWNKLLHTWPSLSSSVGADGSRALKGKGKPPSQDNFPGSHDLGLPAVLSGAGMTGGQRESKGGETESLCIHSTNMYWALCQVLLDAVVHSRLPLQRSSALVRGYKENPHTFTQPVSIHST